MIIESLIGLIMNVVVADSASGQALTKGILMANKLDNLSKEGVKEETNQIIKDTILEIGKQKNDNGNP